MIDWNALPWRFELAAPLVLIALIVLAVPIVTLIATRSVGGPVGAYLVGAIGVLLLGGREGATVNYFLDLSAALALAAATDRAATFARPSLPGWRRWPSSRSGSCC